MPSIITVTNVIRANARILFFITHSPHELCIRTLLLYRKIARKSIRDLLQPSGDEKPASREAGTRFRYRFIFYALAPTDSFRSSSAPEHDAAGASRRAWRDHVAAARERCSQNPAASRV